MTIYHYTSIQTLALILRYKTFRFNRLDQVDDIEESAYGSGPTDSNLSQYCYVSCWTKSAEENLALWNMYTRYKGVRIGLDEMPFVTYQINAHFKSFFNKMIGIESDYFYSCITNEAKLYDINYEDNPELKIRELIRLSHKGGLLVSTPYIGLYKRKEWAIQQESRFKVLLHPVDLLSVARNIDLQQGNALDCFMALFENVGASLAQSKPIKKSFIDLPLMPEKLDNIEIMMGPLTTEADRIIVESLLSPYPKALIKNSAFYGKLRER